MSYQMEKNQIKYVGNIIYFTIQRHKKIIAIRALCKELSKIFHLDAIRLFT